MLLFLKDNCESFHIQFFIDRPAQYNPSQLAARRQRELEQAQSLTRNPSAAMPSAVATINKPGSNNDIGSASNAINAGNASSAGNANNGSKGVGASSAAAAGLSNGNAWTCTACTFNNPATAVTCVVCNTPKGAVNEKV